MTFDPTIFVVGGGGEAENKGSWILRVEHQHKKNLKEVCPVVWGIRRSFFVTNLLTRYPSERYGGRQYKKLCKMYVTSPYTPSNAVDFITIIILAFDIHCIVRPVALWSRELQTTSSYGMLEANIMWVSRPIPGSVHWQYCHRHWDSWATFNESRSGSCSTANIGTEASWT